MFHVKHSPWLPRVAIKQSGATMSSAFGVPGMRASRCVCAKVGVLCTRTTVGRSDGSTEIA